MNAPVLTCAVEDVADWYPRLFIEPHIVACVAVMSRYSQSPGVFAVDCANVASEWLGNAISARLELSWRRQTEDKASRLQLTMQPKPLVEMAAVVVGLVLSRRVVGLRQLDVTAYGDRADYRSLSPACVLEISGTETPGELPRRHREKVAQALTNPFGLDAYVAICAFTASGHRVRLSCHRYGGQADG